MPDSTYVTDENGDIIHCSSCGFPIEHYKGIEIAISQLHKTPHHFDPEIDEYYHHGCAQKAIQLLLK